MELLSLGYIGVNSTRTADWDDFAAGLLGMEKADQGAGVRAYRMDDRRQRLVVTDDGPEGLAFLGWEVAEAAALDRLAARLEAHGTRVSHGERRLADERHVAGLIVFHDPSGNRLEAFYGPAAAASPFVPGRPISGFVTGPLGMGHAVLHVKNAEFLLPFYRDILGFAVTDYGFSPYTLYFFHINGRHHSFAMVGTGHAGLHHFMIEVASLDDVGQGYDIAQLQEGRVAYTLGRHTNDHVTSFYTHPPGNFFIEYGWAGRVIDPKTWVAHETFDGPSLWGHERLYMEPEPRARLRDMRLDAAARGVRAPNPNCAWLDAAITAA
jgi:2,3-dihydroxybiphenyl 1,2-dioxygenase